MIYPTASIGSPLLKCEELQGYNIKMRLCALLAVLLACSSSVFSVLTHDAYQSDWHFALFGIPETIFFHRPSASSSATLLYVLSERGVFGAVNPKDGTVVWRQALTSLTTKLNSQSPNVLTPEEQKEIQTLKSYQDAKGLVTQPGASFVVTHFGPQVSAWDAASGKLIWQWLAPDNQLIQQAQLVTRSQKGSSPIDVIVLAGRESEEMVKLDGASGAVIWQQHVPG